jgi:hypothetical protein
MRNLAFLFFCICFCCVHAQQIHIRFVDAKHLKPVMHDCAWISLGGWRTVDDMNAKNPSQLFVPVNSTGSVQIQVDAHTATARAVGVANSCQPEFALGPSPFEGGRLELAVLSGRYWDCQTNKLASPPPAFSLEQIFHTGVVAQNLCSRLRPKAKPGELVIVVREWTAKERRENPTL